MAEYRRPRSRKKKTDEPEVPPPQRTPTQEKLEDWRFKIAQARRVRKDWETRFDVERAEDFLLGKQDTDPNQLVLNHFWATWKTGMANLFYKSPKFFVRAKPGRATPASEQQASIGEAVLEAVSTHDQNLKRAGKLAVHQSYFRIGVLKIIHDPHMEPNPQAGEPIYERGPGNEPVLDPLTGEPRQMRDPQDGALMTEPDEVMTDQVYRFQWVDAATMLLPDEGPDMSQWTWIGEEVTVPLDDAKQDVRFPAALRTQLVANATLLTPDASRPKRIQEAVARQPELFRYVECYDLRAHTWYVLADGQEFDDFLVDEDLPEWIDDHPYAILPGYTPIQGPEPCPWPMPHVAPWLDPQTEYNIRRRQMMEGAKRSARKILFEDNTFPDLDEAIKALQDPADMIAAKVMDVKRPPVVLEAPDLNPAVYKDYVALQADWRAITGQSGARLTDPDANTATEASFVERQASLRDSDMQDAINDWLATAGQKMLLCLRKTLTIDLWIKLRQMSDRDLQSYLHRLYGIDPQMFQTVPALAQQVRQRYGQEKWQQVSREDLDFDADVTVQAGSTRPKNLEAEKRSWMQFLGLLGASPHIALNPTLLRETLAKFEIDSDTIVDELTATAKKMVEINANQAGRNQGGAPGGGPSNGATNPVLSAAGVGGP